MSNGKTRTPASVKAISSPREGGGYPKTALLLPLKEGDRKIILLGKLLKLLYQVQRQTEGLIDMLRPLDSKHILKGEDKHTKMEEIL